MAPRQNFDIDGIGGKKLRPEFLPTALTLMGAILAAAGAALTHYGGGRWQAVVMAGLMIGVALIAWVYIRRQFIELVTFVLTFTMPIALNVELFQIHGEPSPAGAPINFTLWDKDFLMLILGANWLVDLVLRREKPTASLGAAGWWMAFLTFWILSFPINSVCPTRSFVAWIEWVRLALIFTYLAKTVDSRKMLMWIVQGIMVQIWLEGIVALAQYASGGKLGLTFLGEVRVKEMEMPGGALIRTGALMGHPNALALWLCMIAPLPLALGLNPNEKPQMRVWYGATYLMAQGILIMTFSRAGWACGVLGLFLVHHIAQKRFGKPTVISIWVPVIGFALFGAILWMLSPEVRHRLGGPDTGSAFARIPQMMTAFNIIIHMPFVGTGVGSYAPYIFPYANFDGRYLSALFFRVHNGFLLFTAEGGIPAGIGYLAFWWAVLRKGWGIWRVKDDHLALIGLAVMVGLLAWWLKSMYNIHHPLGERTIFLQWALVFIVWNVHRRETSKKE